jgi:hypothetical protein
LIPVFAIVSAVMLTVARQKGDTALAVPSNVRRVLPSASPAVWLFGAVVLGISLRIFVAMLFPPIPFGNWNPDMLRYWDLAQRLADGRDYTTPEGPAQWPPGLPLVLALLLPVFGSSAYIAHFVARISSRAKSAPRICIYERRRYSGRPSSSMRFSEATAMATSVICRPLVRERSASPITRL